MNLRVDLREIRRSVGSVAGRRELFASVDEPSNGTLGNEFRRALSPFTHIVHEKRAKKET